MSDARREKATVGQRVGYGGGVGGEAESGQLCESAATGKKGHFSTAFLPQTIKYEQPKTAASTLAGVYTCNCSVTGEGEPFRFSFTLSRAFDRCRSDSCETESPATLKLHSNCCFYL